jgi:uncharacterized membrane protein YhaH (DUF805 family)
MIKLRLLSALSFFRMTSSLLAQGQPPSPDAACAACGGGIAFFFVAIIAIIALNIALLVWVARDAKSRGMDNAVLWMVLVMFTSFVGLIIYYYSRPQGVLIQCEHCGGKRLQVSAKCPKCGNA